MQKICLNIQVRSKAKYLFEHRFSVTKDYGIRFGAVEFNSIFKEDNISLIS